jgi:hypothetical protein
MKRRLREVREARAKGREVRTVEQMLEGMIASVSVEEWAEIQHHYNTSVDYHCLADLMDDAIPQLQTGAQLALALRNETTKEEDGSDKQDQVQKPD